MDYLRRMVTLGPNHFGNPGSVQDPRYANNLGDLKATKTHWAKLWVDWNILEPNPGQIDWWRVGQLDDQIRYLQGNGIAIVLGLVHTFPRWANNTTDAELARMSSADRAALDADRQDKPYERRWPSDLSTNGPWARMISLLANRYSANNPNRPGQYCYVNFLELMNEPNLLFWPQVQIECYVVQMFSTAQVITDYLGSQPALMGPGTWDGDHDDAQNPNHPRYTGLQTFQDRVLGLGFAARGNFMWSIHNYGDVTYDRNWSAATTRARLKGSWPGWGGTGDPWIWMSEGGVALQWISGNRDTQNSKVKSCFSRMNNQTEGQGAGVACFTNYLNYSDPNFDSGLREPAEWGGAARPVFNTWANLPEYP
jgi:hypothetical protein